MNHLAIIGAGELGGALAHLVARRNLARSVRLIDENAAVAAGKALDIAQAGAIEASSTTLSSGADVYGAAGADVLVVADAASGGPWDDEHGLMLLKRLTAIGHDAPILCIGAAHRTLVERGCRELRIDRRRLLGSAPEALAAAVRALVALEANGSPQDVALTILGVPPSHVVVPWDEATIAGLAATRVLDGPAMRRLAARVQSLWPPGPYALAAAAAKAIEGIVGRSHRLVSCFVAPDDSAGVRMRASAVPVQLGREGVVRVATPILSVRDRVMLENGTLL